MEELEKKARLALKLLLGCVIAVLAMSSKAADLLSQPRGECNRKFCVPVEPPQGRNR